MKKRYYLSGVPEEGFCLIVFVYEYAIRDHLGNGRVYFSDLNEDSEIQIGGVNSELLQEEQYYPFGLAHEGPFYPQQPITNPYQYNGKELNEEFGLGWLAFGFRWYDPAIGRFTAVDPIAEDFAHVSTYNYAENDPIAHIDLWGLQKAKPDEVGTKPPGTVGIPIGSGADVRRENTYATHPLSGFFEAADIIIEKVDEVFNSNDPDAQNKPREEPITPVDGNNDEERFIFRGMKENKMSGGLLPETGESARTLGVRPNVDIPVNADGTVLPGTGGMSVAPDTPTNLPRHRRPPGYGGTGKDPVFETKTSNLPAGLRFIQDSPTHGVIEPSMQMSLQDYQRLLQSTQGLWKNIGGNQTNPQ